MTIGAKLYPSALVLAAALALSSSWSSPSSQAQAAQASCGSSAAAPPAPRAGTWVVSFEDDFAGDALNASSWTASNYSSVVSKYDGHDALFIADRVAVADGKLVITTAWDPHSFDGVQYNLTSGWVDSQGKRNQTRGRFEASIKMPSNESVGSWPAWWLLPEGSCWPIGGEVDIVEFYVGEGHFQHSRTDNPAQASSSYHFGFGCGDDLYKYPNDTVWWPSGEWEPNWPIVDFSADFHVFGVEINETALRYYIDNATNTVMTISAPPLCVTAPDFVFGESMYLPWSPMYGILNVAVNNGQDPTGWWKTNNATTLVDWVRWWTFVPEDAPAASD